LPQGHELKGRALLGLGQLQAAAEAFRAGLQHQDGEDDTLRAGLAETERRLRVRDCTPRGGGR
jgi:hypothetical protein